MPVDIRVPALGESVVEATVNRWFKPEGAAVTEGEDLVELDTDKVNVTIPAEASGVLEKIVKKEGETVSINDVLGVLNESAAASAPAVRPAAAEAAAGSPSGAGTATAVSAAAVQTEAQGNGRAPSVSPVAQQLASANGVDLAQVTGSGAGGKIVKEDIEAYLGQRGRERPVEALQDRDAQAQTAAPAGPPVPAGIAETPVKPAEPARPPQAPAAPAASTTRGEERVPLSRLRLTIIDKFQQAKREAVTLTTFNEVDMSAIMEVRKRRRDSFKERHGVGLGFMSFFTKAVMGGLKAFPYLNAEIQGNEVVLKHYYDIGIAVSTDQGLVVPIVRDADRKSFAEIEREIADLAARARERKLTLPELQGGTFSITNGGVFGSLLATPLLNYPQVGILGMHKIEERPRAVNGQVVIKPMMYVALTYDHRIVDGRESVSFLVRVKELLEDPETLLLEG